MRSNAYASARPRYGLNDIVVLLWRELWVMILVFLLIFIAGAAAALMMPKTYTATASLFVSLGQEYVYNPSVGDAARGAIPEVGEVAQSEAAILNSEELKRRVVRVLGPGVFAAGAPVAGEDGAETAAVRAIGSGLDVGLAPESGIIQLSYEGDSPEHAARILNAIIDQYLIYRREVFRDTTTPALAGQRERFEEDLAAADAAYETFLDSNEIGDFTTARETLAATYQTTFAERLANDAALSVAEQRLQSLRTQLGAVPAEIVLQQDINIAARDQILQARTEREQLLSRYQPDAQPVKDIEARIAQLEQYVAGGDAEGPKEMRTGPNPMWVQLDTERIQTQAERDSLLGKRAVLERQLGDLRARQQRLTELESRNATLAGNREVLSTSIRDFTLRETQSRAAAELAQNGADNIRVVERASPPATGSSLKLPLLILAFAFAAFTALCVGLLRIFLRPGFSTAGSAGRTLQMPVLAVAPMKAR